MYGTHRPQPSLCRRTSRLTIPCGQVGEIVVYNVKDKDIPIVHRIVRKFGNG
jgi:hypothetical protein